MKFDFQNQFESVFGKHRSGWSYVISFLKDLHDPNSPVYFDTFIERTYTWGQNPDYHPKAYIPKKPWIGIIHTQPYIPKWFDLGSHLEAFLNLPTWKESYKFCLGIFTLSNYHRHFLENILDVPVDVIYHPIDVPYKMWSFENFLRNNKKSLVQVGWWCRNLHAIFELPPNKYHKIFLKVRHEEWFEKIMQEEKRERIRLGKFKESMYETAEIKTFLSNEEYDELLSKNIVFVYLYDASANNTVVECISRATPLLINKIPPVVEYLGEEYPFYYSSYEEAIEKANDYDLVLKTHEYLKTYSIRDKLTPQYFKESILKSFIVKQIEKDLEINSLGDKRKLIFRKSTKFDDTIYIVTPCYNAVETIDQTILSVVSQAGPFSIRYHVQDGGSTDGTLEKLEEWKWKIENQIVPTFCKKVDFTFDSAPDNGMYDAIVKGFQYIDNIPSKAMMTWINADDLVLHGCFATAYLISKNFDAEEIPWITGIPYVKRNFYPQPFNLGAIYPQEIVASGCADGIHWFDIQQEGTFFRKWLWDEVNAVEELPKFRHAGDWNLWRLFAKVTSPVLVPWVLAMFRYNPDKPTQLSIKFKNQRESEIEATVPLEDRRNSLRTLVEEGTLSYLRIKMPCPGDKIFLVKKKPILMAPYHYYQVFNEWPQNSIYKEKWREEEEEIILERETKYIQSFTPLKSKTITEEPAKFYIVTPSLNSASTIDETILSVVSQEGDFYIYYHIQDGGSVDLTLERLLYWEAVLSNPNPYVKCRGVYFSWASEPDSSMYEAILKGFSKFIIRPDDFITWINADDVLLPGALATVCAIKRDNPHIHWIGSPQYVFEKKPYEPVFFRRTPTPTDVIRQGLCDGKSWPMLQQEGTFFKYHLFFKSKHVLRHFKFAGDFALWMEMAKYAEYYQSEKPLGAFRRRKGQLSVEHHAEYMKEVEMAKRML